MAQTEDGDNALLARGGGGLPGPVLVNPLAAISSGINAAEGEYRVRGQQANEAAGQAYQGAINPQTGEFDPNDFRRRLAASGPAAMAAGAALLNTQNINSNQFEQDRAKAQWASSRAGTLTRLGPNITEQHALDVLQEGLRTHVLTQPEFDRQSAEVRSFGGDPAKLNSWANQHEFNAMDMEQQLRRKYGTRERISAGGADVIIDQPPPGTGNTTIVPHTMDPATAGGKVEWKDQAGQLHQGTGAQWAVEHGAGRTVGTPTIITTPGPGTPGGAAPPPIPTQPLPGAYQPRGGTPGAPATPGATAAPPATPAGTSPPTVPAAPSSPAVAAAPPPSGYTSTPGPAPGTTQAGEASGTASAGMATELTKRADQVPTNKANYANMLADLERLGKMPPGGERQIAIETFIKKATGYNLTMTEDQVAAGNSFAKLANIAVGQQLAAIGATDSRQQLFMGSNPSLDLSKLGNQQIIHMLQGNEDAIAAKSRAWQDWRKSGKGDDSYGEFQNDFNHHFDPRVFQQQYMAKKEIDDLRASLETTPGAKQKFLDDLAYARGRKWVR